MTKEFTRDDNFYERIGESEVARLRNTRRKRVKSSVPLCFARCSEDIEKRLFVATPDTSTEVETASVPEGGPSNSEIKNTKVAEKRDFEIENCKLNANIKEDSKGQLEPKVLPAGKIEGRVANPFSKNSEKVERIDSKGLRGALPFD